VSGKWGVRPHAEQLPTPRERRPAATVRKQPIGAVAVEALRPYVQEEAAKKLLAPERHVTCVFAGLRLAIAERDRLVRDGLEAVVRDRDAVGVAAEVGERLRRG
jgi:hypothetical protein